jgi:hypothetical protein
LIDKSFRKLHHQAAAHHLESTSSSLHKPLLLKELSNPLIMSLDPPTYLSSLQNNIRARPIPWDGAVRAGTISEDQLSKIRAVDKVRKEQRKQIIEGDLDGYRDLFLGASGKRSVLESAAGSQHVVQYVLVLLGDLLDGIHTCRTYEHISDVY